MEPIEPSLRLDGKPAETLGGQEVDVELAPLLHRNHLEDLDASVSLVHAIHDSV